MCCFLVQDALAFALNKFVCIKYSIVCLFWSSSRFQQLIIYNLRKTFYFSAVACVSLDMCMVLSHEPGEEESVFHCFCVYCCMINSLFFKFMNVSSYCCEKNLIMFFLLIHEENSRCYIEGTCISHETPKMYWK